MSQLEGTARAEANAGQRRASERGAEHRFTRMREAGDAATGS